MNQPKVVVIRCGSYDDAQLINSTFHEGVAAKIIRRGDFLTKDSCINSHASSMQAPTLLTMTSSKGFQGAAAANHYRDHEWYRNKKQVRHEHNSK
jgi:hypothetical protein